MAIDLTVLGQHALLETARTAGLPAGVEARIQAIHGAIDNLMLTRTNAVNLRDTLQFLQQNEFELSNEENRYLVAAELVDGVDSCWAQQDVQNRIESNYGDGWMGRMKAMFAGVSQESLSGRASNQWYDNEVSRRALKVLGKTGISAGVGATMAVGTATLLGGPVAWGAFGLAVGGAAVGRAAVEGYRALTGRERSMRNCVNTDYLARYQEVGQAAQRLLNLERNRVNATLPADIERYEDAIRAEYANIITQTNTDTLKAQEKTVREEEIKWEKRSNWGAVIGGAAGAAAHVLHGVSAVQHGGQQFDFNGDGIYHNVRLNSGDGHFYYNLNPGEAIPHYGAEMGHDWAGGHLLQEGWGNVLGELGKQALEGGMVVAPELFGVAIASAEQNTASADIDARTTSAEGRPETADFRRRVEQATPVEPEAPDPTFAIGNQYLFRPPTGGSLEIEQVPGHGPNHVVSVSAGEMWRIRSVNRNEYTLENVATPATQLVVHAAEFAKGILWEHVAYSPDEWNKTEVFTTAVEYVTSKIGNGITFRDGVSAAVLGALPVKSGAALQKIRYDVMSVTPDRNEMVLVNASTGETTTVKISEIINLIKLEAAAGAASAGGGAEKTDVEKFVDAVKLQEGKPYAPHDIIYFGANVVEGSTTVVDVGADGYIWEVHSIDEGAKTFTIKPDGGGSAVTLSFDSILGYGMSLGRFIDTELSDPARTNKPDRSRGPEGNRRRLLPGQEWTYNGASRGKLITGHVYEIIDLGRRSTVPESEISIKDTIAPPPPQRPFQVSKLDLVDTANFDFKP